MRLLKILASIAAPVAAGAAAPATLINLGVGMLAKHALRWLPNASIPYLNVALSTGVALAKKVSEGQDVVSAILPALTEGTGMAGASTLLHQCMKIPLASAITGEAAKAVGPGEKFSI